MKNLVVAAVAAALIVASACQPVVAAPVTITNYSVSGAMPSGFGYWGYTYSDTVTSTGSTVQLSGGSGTLNDAVTNAGVGASMLFLTDSSPTITLFFSAAYTINSITIDERIGSGNAIPGAIGGLMISSSTSSKTFSGLQGNQAPTLTLNLTGNSLTLSNITATQFMNYFNISEILVDGSLASIAATAVPEPTSLGLVATALLTTGLFGWRRKSAKC